MKTLFVFPGQGSQYVGMLNPWKNHLIIKETIDYVSNILKKDLISLINYGSKEEINLTINTQPIILTICIAIFKEWLNYGGKYPDFFAGHSLGEYTAVLASKAITLKSAIKLVELRSYTMHNLIASKNSAMYAIIGITSNDVIQLCHVYSQESLVEAVNFNSPLQTVIAGYDDGVRLVIMHAKTMGAKCIKLNVSLPFHSSIMKPVSAVIKNRLSYMKVKDAVIPIINNINGSIIKDTYSIKYSLINQIFNPVRWIDIIDRAKKEGVTHIVEFGPSRVLENLVKKIDKDIISLSIRDSQSLEQVLTIINN